MSICILILVLWSVHSVALQSWRVVLVYFVDAFLRCDVTSLPVTDCIIQALLLRHNLSITHHRNACLPVFVHVIMYDYLSASF